MRRRMNEDLESCQRVSSGTTMWMRGGGGSIFTCFTFNCLPPQILGPFKCYRIYQEDGPVPACFGLSSKACGITFRASTLYPGSCLICLALMPALCVTNPEYGFQEVWITREETCGAPIMESFLTFAPVPGSAEAMASGSAQSILFLLDRTEP